MIRTLMMMVVAATLTVGFTSMMTGCEKKSDTEKMVDKMEDGADKVKDKVEDAAEEATDAIKDATN